MNTVKIQKISINFMHEYCKIQLEKNIYFSEACIHGTNSLLEKKSNISD